MSSAVSNHGSVQLRFPLKLSSFSLHLSLVLFPSGSVEAGDHHDVGFADVNSLLELSRHHLEGLQVFQRVHLKGLPQVDWGGKGDVEEVF